MPGLERLKSKIKARLEPTIRRRLFWHRVFSLLSSLNILYFSITRHLIDASPTTPRRFIDRHIYRTPPIYCSLAVYPIFLPRQIVDRCATNQNHIVPALAGPFPAGFDPTYSFQLIKNALYGSLGDPRADTMQSRCRSHADTGRERPAISNYEIRFEI